MHPPDRPSSRQPHPFRCVSRSSSHHATHSRNEGAETYRVLPTPLGIFAHYQDKLVRFRVPPEVIQHMNQWDCHEECVPRTFEFDHVPWEVAYNS